MSDEIRQAAIDALSSIEISMPPPNPGVPSKHGAPRPHPQPPQKPSTRGLRIEAVTHNCVKPDLSWIPDGTKVSWRCPVCRRKWTGWANGGIWQGGRASWRYRRREAKRILSAQDTGAR